MNDKREYSRMQNEFSVRLSKEALEEVVELDEEHGKSINVSANGLLINTRKPIENGTRLKIAFLKPNSFDMFKGTGIVVRSEKNAYGTYSIGINFTDLTQSDLRKLDYYITKNEE